MFSYNSSKYSYLIITRNNKVLKDIYSPLEIDDQWDQRAPSHEDKVEGGNPDGMSPVPPQMQAENPSGGVAVIDQPTAPDMPVTPGVASPEAPAMNEAPSTPNAEEPTVTGSITNIGQMTVPAETVDSPNDTNTTAMATEEAPVTMESTSTDAPGAEAPDEAIDDDAATMLGSGQQSGTTRDEEHDIPASPYDTVIPENDINSSNEPGDATIETAAIPTTTVEPDEAHIPKEETDKDAVKQIVKEPLSDDEREAVASDADQKPVSPGPNDNETHTQEAEDNKKTRAEETLNSMIEAIDSELKKLADKLKDYQEKQARIESDIEATQAEIDAKNVEKDDFVASVKALNVRPSITSAPDNDLEQAA
ncbi:MAG TPA: hypothetical protein PJ993_02200 [Candidatus Saccharibacteria bacterium]|nr:hypothetical protein [Candidatus Saccharibacteria bacterium]